MKPEVTEQLVKIPHATIVQAWENWIDFHYGVDCETTTERFFKLVDPEDENLEMIYPWDDPEDGSDEVSVTQDIATRLNMLTGPHYYVYIKAYYANHPWK